MSDKDWISIPENATLDELISLLAQAQSRQEQFEENYGPVLKEYKDAKQIAKELEERVRAVAIRAFVESGDMYPHDLISVTEKEKATYPIEENVERIIQHDDFHFLTIDMPRFKKAIEEGQVTYASIQVKKEPSTVLASSKLWRYAATGK